MPECMLSHTCGRKLLVSASSKAVSGSLHRVKACLSRKALFFCAAEKGHGSSAQLPADGSNVWLYGCMCKAGANFAVHYAY